MTNRLKHQSWSSTIRLREQSSALALAVVLLLAVVAIPWAQAQTYSVLYAFSGESDGANSLAGLVRDAAGNLYGTTSYGGSAVFGCQNRGCGVVFKLDTTGKETVLYSFCSEKNCTDGAAPSASLVRDAAGNLYGTTARGGVSGCSRTSCGVVFKVDTTGKETVLHTFTGGADGGVPDAGLSDAAGNLYGTTLFGGDFGNCRSGRGVVFKLTP
jgi:uncharacterized repeat protein (TIGR03803 family)